MREKSWPPCRIHRMTKTETHSRRPTAARTATVWATQLTATQATAVAMASVAAQGKTVACSSKASEPRSSTALAATASIHDGTKYSPTPKPATVAATRPTARLRRGVSSRNRRYLASNSSDVIREERRSWDMDWCSASTSDGLVHARSLAAIAGPFRASISSTRQPETTRTESLSRRLMRCPARASCNPAATTALRPPSSPTTCSRTIDTARTRPCRSVGLSSSSTFVPAPSPSRSPSPSPSPAGPAPTSGPRLRRRVAIKSGSAATRRRRSASEAATAASAWSALRRTDTGPLVAHPRPWRSSPASVARRARAGSEHSVCKASSEASSTARAPSSPASVTPPTTASTAGAKRPSTSRARVPQHERASAASNAAARSGELCSGPAHAARELTKPASPRARWQRLPSKATNDETHDRTACVRVLQKLGFSAPPIASQATRSAPCRARKSPASASTDRAPPSDAQRRSKKSRETTAISCCS